MRWTLLLMMVCAVSGRAVKATVLLPAEFREIVQGSELIAYGRVADVRAEWVDGRTRIESVVTFEVASWLKGGSERTISFRVPGGEMGRYRTVMVGAPVFKPGDEVVIFLKTTGSELPVVFGLNQGVFRVRIDDAGRRLVVSPPLIASGDAPETVRRGALARRPVPLDTFGAQVRSVMAEYRGAR